MGGFFSLDGPFNRVGSVVADIMILGVLWLIFSIPLITIGASTTALFYVSTRRISDREGYLLRDFFSSFKSNFFTSTKIWLIWLVLFGMLVVNINLLWNEGAIGGMLGTLILALQIVLMLELVFISVYLYPLVARFEMGAVQIAKSAFFMANRHIFTTLTCLSIGFTILLAAEMFFPPLFVIGMGIYGYGASYMVMRIFRKYRPEMDEKQMIGESIDAAAQHAATMAALSAKPEDETQKEEGVEDGT